MTIEGCHAVLRAWGWTFIQPLHAGATLWMDRFGEKHWVPNLAPMTFDDRVEFLRLLAEQIGESIPAAAA